jgi:alpha-1,3-mannosyltransferase
MKVLQVTRQFSPAVGGIENMVLNLCRHLSQIGIQCDVVTLNRRFDTKEKLPAFEQFEWGTVYRIPFIGSRRYPIAPRVLSHLSNYDVVHIHAIDFFVDYLSITRSLHSKPLVVSTHGGFFHTRWAYLLKRIYFRTITRLTLHFTDRVICDSWHDYNIFEQIVPLNKLQLIPNGIDFEYFSQLTRNPECGKIISIGRIQENKRLDRLLRVFAEVSREHPYLTLTIIEGDWDGSRSTLQSEAVELGIQDQVEFAGFVSNERLTQHLSSAHLWASSSEYEAFGIALLEAMAARTVPIVQPIPAFQEFIDNGKNGFLVDFSQAGRAAQTICDILEMDNSALAKIAKQSQEKAREYAWSNVVPRFEEVYQDVLSSS